MKHILYILVALVALLTAPNTTAQMLTPVTKISYAYNQLPTSVRLFLDTHFTSIKAESISYTPIQDLYDITLSNNINLTINGNAQVQKICANKHYFIDENISASILPRKAMRFLDKHKLTRYITEIERTPKDSFLIHTEHSSIFGIKNNQHNLKFNSAGQLIDNSK